MMKELLSHLDELNTHIKNLDDEIDHHMKPEEKQAVEAIKNVTGIADVSAQAIIAVNVKNSYFYAKFKRISAHRGSKRAYVAVAHSILIAIYHILKDGVKFEDLGADYYNQFNKERKINSYLKKLKSLGWEMPSAITESPA